MAQAVVIAKTRRRPRLVRRGVRDMNQIRLGLTARLLINLFTVCDGFNALTDRRFFRHRPYAYGPYLSRAQAKTFSEKMHVIWAAKQVKTKKIIQARERYGGEIPDKVKTLCKKTPCGYLRLWAAYLTHPN